MTQFLKDKEKEENRTVSKLCGEIKIVKGSQIIVHRMQKSRVCY